MKKIYLIALGLIPLIIGLIYNTIIMNMQVNQLFLNIIAILIWGVIGVLVASKTKSLVKSTCFVHLIPTLFLFFIIFQLLITGSFFMNTIGFISQMPFLMFAGVSGILCSVLFSNISTVMIFVAAYVIQVLIFVIGYKIGEKRVG